MKKIVFVCGRTGGPILPFAAIIKNIKCSPIMVGVKGGFEEKYCSDYNYPLHFLPEVKLKLLSFGNLNFLETVSNLVDFAKSLGLFGYSLVKSIFLLYKLCPTAIYSTGSFLAVPLVLASKILFWKNIKIIIHQQDPLIGLSNRICQKFADLKSCSFEYTKQKNPSFELIDNPFEPTFEEIKNQDLERFLKIKTNPKFSIFMIFGGGSGSEVINNWVIENIQKLTQNYKILHLTGILQEKKLAEIRNKNYFRIDILTKDMLGAMQKSDFVLCRAGLGSITELNYLQKPTFLVPIPNSHQELNAYLSPQFVTLDQNQSNFWLGQIQTLKAKAKFLEQNPIRQQAYYTRFKEICSQK